MKIPKEPPQASVATQCIHAGAGDFPDAFGINTPVITSTAFNYRTGHVRYPRYYNSLNHEVVATRLAALEGGETALITTSGLGALSCIFLGLLRPGEHAILLDGIYGGTMDLVEGLLQPLGMRFSLWNGDPETLDALITETTRLLLVESPTNPLLGIVDLARVTAIAKARGLISIMDNTFASPILQRPLTLGFSLVMHSATKYLGGHSDLMSGAVVGASSLLDPIRTTAIRLGCCLNGHDLAGLERSLKTLAVRVREQSTTAGELARRLNGHKGIAHVFYPGLPEHPGHAIARRQMTDFGAMLSLRLAPASNPERFLDRLELIQPAVSLGGVESTICQPTQTSHAKVSPEERKRLGMNDHLMRVSVGLESVDDLWEDLEHALQIP
jgi:cystathionine beta-lyase/cystathionine gamma-synthase